MRIDDSSIRVDRHSCIACGICVDRCIMDNLRLSVAPCRQACPVGMNCQGYIRLIAMDKEKKALEQLQHFGPLLPLLAAECTAPCENACARKKKDGAVHILELKRYMAAKYSDTFNTINLPAFSTGKNISIIGAGISGLTCGLKAVQSGHRVTVWSTPADENKKKKMVEDIITALDRAGASFSNTAVLKSTPDPFKKADAVVLSRYDEHHDLVPDGLEIMPGKRADPVSHLLSGNIFCSDTGSAQKGVVFEIADAFETIESVNRFLQNDPLDWGRGFYSQDGAVRVYKPDTRVGTGEKRTPEKEITGGFDDKTAKSQASRCFGCGRAFEKNQTCWYCLPCELECPTGALNVDIPYLVK